MRISEIGEFGLIRLIEQKVRERSVGRWKERLVVGIGDDAAAWRTTGQTEVATTDTLVEGVHFIPGAFSWPELGWKAMAANLSDIAAMGATPAYALVSLSLPESAETEDILGLYDGMLELAMLHDVLICGGNLTSAPVFTITIAIIGVVEGDAMLLRSKARPGDKVAVTGYIGASAAAVRLLKGQVRTDAETEAVLREAHFRPKPRIAEAQALVRSGVRAGMDISDGLLSDLTRICEASRVGAIVEQAKVPVHPALPPLFGENASELAMTGGEDFELLFTAGEAVVEKVKQALSLHVTVVGEITADHAGEVVVKGERPQTRSTRYKNTGTEYTGWDHFRKPSA